MKLLSARIKNYRIHRDIEVDFAPDGITIIGGPNEAGKSTLAEAIHRALFLKSKITGDTLKKMKSQFAPSSPPEVTVEFEADGKKCSITKVFKGQQGISRLDVDGKNFQGEEAERRLSELLGEDVCKGRGATEALNRWSHIWVWQGKSGDDFSGDIALQNDRLIQRLQETGGGIVQQTDLDALVARKFHERVNDIFTKLKQPKKGSRLFKLQKGVENAQHELDQARHRVHELETARQIFIKAEKSLKEDSKALEAQEAEKLKVEKKLQQAGKLQEQAAEYEQRVTGLQRDLSSLEKLDKEIKALVAEEHESKDEFESASARVREIEKELSEIVKQQEKVAVSVRDAGTRLARARSANDWARCWIRIFELGHRQQELEDKKKKIERHQEKLEKVMAEMAALPSIDQKLRDEIERVSKQLRDAEISLRAMAAGIEVVKAGSPVLVNGQEISPGTSHVVTDHASISIGDDVVLTIQPGGGQALKEARQEEENARSRLNDLLRKAGVSSAEEAVEVHENLIELKRKKKDLETRIDDLGGNFVQRSLRELEHEIASVREEIQRHRQTGTVNETDPATLEDARKIMNKYVAVTQELAEHEENLKSLLDRLRETEKKQEEARRKAESEAQDIKTSLKAAEASRKAKEDQAGDQEERKIKLARYANEIDSAREELEKLREQVKLLQPAILADRLEMLEKAVTRLQESLVNARENKAGAAAILKQDGTSDPVRQLREAEARLMAAEAELNEESARADALRLVHDLFQEEQKRLEDQYSAPLAQRINHYIRCIFGGGAEVQACFQGNQFKGIKFRHAAGNPEFDYSSLSGGTREQVASAVRLAVAELLAAEHQGSLPVIFDDAFTNSDPERQKAVQTMLFVAVKQGLQPIVLTSNISEYSGLGADVRELAQPALAQGLDSTTGYEKAGLSTGQERYADMPEPGADPSLSQGVGSHASDADRQSFLARLAETGGQAGNTSLRELLGWEQDRYETVKNHLISTGEIITGRGRGGSVRLVNSST